MKFQEGNVFSYVCPSVSHSVQDGSPCDHYPWCIGSHCTGPLWLLHQTWDHPKPCPLNNRYGNLPGHHTWDSPLAPALPPASDIWDYHWRPFQICSFWDSQSDIWWWPLKHIWFGSRQWTSSCNAFLFARKFANGSCKIVFICSTIIHGS